MSETYSVSNRISKYFADERRAESGQEKVFTDEDVAISFALGFQARPQVEEELDKRIFLENREKAEKVFFEFISFLKATLDIEVSSSYYRAKSNASFEVIFVLKKEDLLAKGLEIYSHFDKIEKDFPRIKAALVPATNLNEEALASDGYFWKYQKE